MTAEQVNETIFDEYERATEDIWVNRLLDDFYEFNGLVNLNTNKTLATPNFDITRDPKCLWGSWIPDARIITISRRLVNHYPWEAVQETLKHEMAHMIVEEIFGIKDAPDHGAEFTRACAILGIENERRNHDDKMNTELPDHEKMARKVYKLLALGESSHKGEAESAVAKAQELMTKYNIQVHGRPVSERRYLKRPVGKLYGRLPTYVTTLARLVSDYYYVNYLIRHGRSTGGGWGRRRKHTKYIEFFGEPHNLDIAEYVYHFLLEEGERQWAEFQKSDEYLNRFIESEEDFMDWGDGYGEPRRSGRRRSSYSKVAFIDGLYMGFASKLRQTHDIVKEKVDPENTLPVAAMDKVLNDKYDEAYPSLTSYRTGGYSNTGGQSAGLSRGRSITINPGVRASRSGSPRLIGA